MWNEDDQRFFEMIGIRPDRPERVPDTRVRHKGAEADIYRAFVYWQNQAVRNETLATYLLAALMIVVCVFAIAGLLW
jgi:hypothetical protein